VTVNKVILVGNLGADPEVRTTQGGMAIANLRIATSERRKGQDGAYSDVTEWHRVTVFGKDAENAQKFLKKGRQVYIEGSIRTQKYQDKKTGEDKYSTEIAANQIKFLGGGREEGGDRGGSSGSSAPSGGGSYGGYGNSSGGNPDDDPPF
jgi:single-strand DNA-binding protein